MRECRKKRADASCVSRVVQKNLTYRTAHLQVIFAQIFYESYHNTNRNMMYYSIKLINIFFSDRTKLFKIINFT